MSGLYSPILEQAGFLKRKAAVVVEQWVAQLDGAMQSWQLTAPISLVTAESLNFRVKAAFGTPMLNDQPIDSNITPIPSGGDNTIIAATVGAEALSYITSRAGSSLFLSLAVYNFRVIRSGVVIHEIPLTNKAQGATQLATVGNINAFMPNYTDAVWRKP